MQHHPYSTCHLLIASRLSREEREAAYLRARERIFGKDEKAGDATPGMQIDYLFIDETD